MEGRGCAEMRVKVLSVDLGKEAQYILGKAKLFLMGGGGGGG